MAAFFYTLVAACITLAFLVGLVFYPRWAKKSEPERPYVGEPAPQARQAFPQPQPASASSSLDFIKKEPGPRAEEPGEAVASERRQALQRLAETARRRHPDLYDAFLAQRKLKAIAQRYERSRDFGILLEELAASSEFDRLIGARKSSGATRKLVAALFGDPGLGPELRRITREYAGHPDLQTVLKHGWEAGVPEDAMIQAGVPKPGPRPRLSRRQLRASPTPVKSLLNQP